jgi:monooxygenase
VNEQYYDVIVVGAGLSGIGMGCYLSKNLPNKKYLVVEAREALGGTWDLFTYPGIRSDSAMYTLGYKFKPWTEEKTIADGASILNYIKEAANEYGVDQNIRYSSKIIAGDWDSKNLNWVITIEDSKTGDTSKLRCGHLHMCSGYYDYDKGFTPDFPGLSSFKGKFIHPQKWDHDIDYSGKNIVVIGSGATAVTLVPELAKKAKSVTMLQRSPTYIAPLPEVDPLSAIFKKVLPQNLAYKAARWKHILMGMGFYNYCRKMPNRARKHLFSKVTEILDEGVIDLKHFSPKYNPWDQRLCAVPDGDFFTAINEKKVHIITDEIVSFKETGIELKTEEFLNADIIVSATGLNLKFLSNLNLSMDGTKVDLTKVTAYKSSMLSGIPNMTMVFGYTNSAWTLKADLVNEWVAKTLKFMDKNNYKVVVPRAETVLIESPYIALGSGYVVRALGKMPNQGSRKPWKNNQNYFKDILLYKFRPIADKELVFTNTMN